MCNYLQLFTTVLHVRMGFRQGFRRIASPTAAAAVKKIGLIRQTEDVSSLHHCDLRNAAPTRFASNIAVVSIPSTRGVMCTQARFSIRRRRCGLVVKPANLKTESKRFPFGTAKNGGEFHRVAGHHKTVSQIYVRPLSQKTDSWHSQKIRLNAGLALKILCVFCFSINQDKTFKRNSSFK